MEAWNLLTAIHSYIFPSQHKHTRTSLALCYLHMPTIEGNQLDPRLYLDYGDGVSEEHAFYLTFTDKEHWQALLPMPCLLKSIRPRSLVRARCDSAA